MDSELKKKRAYTGMAYQAFEMLLSGEPEDAKVLLGTLCKHLMVDADIDIPLTPSVLDRLTEEALEYLIENQTIEW